MSEHKNPTCWKCKREMAELDNDVWRMHKSGDRSRKVSYFCFGCFTCVEIKTIEYAWNPEDIYD